MIKSRKCKKCGKEVYRVELSAGKYISCEPKQVVYCENKSGKQTIVRPNGEIVSGAITTDMQRATGIGYIVHCCNKES